MGAFLIGLSSLLFAAIFTFSTQLIIYSTWNLIINCLRFGFQNLLHHELSSGIISLRIASMIIGLHVIVLTLKIQIVLWSFNGDRQIFIPRTSRFNEIQQLSNFCNETDLFYCHLFQYGIYIVVINSLWLFVFFEINNLSVRMLNWLLFFIVDDWVIISQYLQILKGRISKPHIYRLAVTNVLFLVGLIYNAIVSLSWYYILPITIIMLTLNVGFYIKFIRELLLLSEEDKIKEAEERYSKSLGG